TVEAWSVALFELIVLVMMLVWGAKTIIHKRLEINLPTAVLPLAAFVVLAMIQSIAINGSGQPSQSLSMDVEATRAALVVIFFLFVCFLIASNFFSTTRQLHSLANFLVVFGLVLA